MPYDEGYRAYGDGDDQEENPYPAESEEAKEWQRGYKASFENDCMWARVNGDMFTGPLRTIIVD